MQKTKLCFEIENHLLLRLLAPICHPGRLACERECVCVYVSGRASATTAGQSWCREGACRGGLFNMAARRARAADDAHVATCAGFHSCVPGEPRQRDSCVSPVAWHRSPGWRRRGIQGARVTCNASCNVTNSPSLNRNTPCVDHVLQFLTRAAIALT